MAKTDDFVLHVHDLLAPLGPVRSRAMFGGHCFFLGDLPFALIADGRLYLKADELAKGAFEEKGCEPFVYDDGKGKSVAMSYWSAPEEAMEEPHAMRPWAERAIEAARRKHKPRKARKKPAEKVRGRIRKRS